MQGWQKAPATGDIAGYKLARISDRKRQLSKTTKEMKSMSKILFCFDHALDVFCNAHILCLFCNAIFIIFIKLGSHKHYVCLHLVSACALYNILKSLILL